jgi:hypothetical protein
MEQVFKKCKHRFMIDRSGLGDKTAYFALSRLVGVLLVSDTLSGCYRDVDMDLVNPLNFDQNVTIQEYTPDQSPQGSPIYAGTVPAKKDNDYLLPQVRIGHYLDISGSANSSAKGGQRITVVSGDGAQKVIAALPPGTAILTDVASADQLLGAFLVIGPQTGFPPTDLNEALTNVVGSVRCYTPPTQSNPFSNVVWSEPPGVFSDLVATPDPYPYPSRSISKAADVTSGASASAGASVPLYGSIKGSFKSSGLDKYTLQYLNFGPKSKVENLKTFVDVPTALNRLSEADKQALLAAMSAANVVCTYFNNYFVMKTMNVEVEHSKQAQSSADISIATVFTADGAYNYQSDSTEKGTLTDSVFNVWGTNFTVAKDPSSAQGKTVLLYLPGDSSKIPIGAGQAAATKKPTS